MKGSPTIVGMYRSGVVVLLSLSVLSIVVFVKCMDVPSTGNTNNLSEGRSDMIDITYRGHLYFTLDFNDETGNFINETGADPLYLNTDFYNDRSFIHSNIIQMRQRGVGTEPETVKVVRDKINFRIGQHELTSTVTPILNLSYILGDLGLIGNGILDRFDLVLDHTKNHLMHGREIPFTLCMLDSGVSTISDQSVGGLSPDYTEGAMPKYLDWK